MASKTSFVVTPPATSPREPVSALLRRALREHRPVRVQIGEQLVLLWPYVLGRRAGRLYVLALALGDRFRDEQWLPVAAIAEAHLTERVPWMPPGGTPDAKLGWVETVEVSCSEYRVGA